MIVLRTGIVCPCHRYHYHQQQLDLYLDNNALTTFYNPWTSTFPLPLPCLNLKYRSLNLLIFSMVIQSSVEGNVRGVRVRSRSIGCLPCGMWRQWFFQFQSPFLCLGPKEGGGEREKKVKVNKKGVFCVLLLVTLSGC